MMTSATGPKRASSRPRRRGFTLLEVVLALGVYVLLASMLVLSLAGASHREDLDEATVRLGTALRRARAEAARRGRRVCFVLRDEAGGFAVLWEPEPLADPGRFAPMPATWTADLPSDLAEVTRVELTGPAAWRAVGYQTAPMLLDGMIDPGEVLLFAPDGSSDSALVEIAALASDDARRGLVEIDGAAGTVTSRVLTPAALDAYYAERQEAADGW